MVRRLVLLWVVAGACCNAAEAQELGAPIVEAFIALSQQLEATCPEESGLLLAAAATLQDLESMAGEREATAWVDAAEALTNAWACSRGAARAKDPDSDGDHLDHLASASGVAIESLGDAAGAQAWDDWSARVLRPRRAARWSAERADRLTCRCAGEPTAGVPVTIGYGANEIPILLGVEVAGGCDPLDVAERYYCPRGCRLDKLRAGETVGVLRPLSVTRVGKIQLGVSGTLEAVAAMRAAPPSESSIRDAADCLAFHRDASAKRTVDGWVARGRYADDQCVAVWAAQSSLPVGLDRVVVAEDASGD